MMKVLTQAEQLAATRDALRLQAEKVAHSYLRGPHGRRRSGQGERFWQFRPYHAGDMPRDIDWRQSAKRDDVFVREREHEAAQSLWLYRDASASMRFASRKSLPAKVDYAEVIVLALALLAMEAGERAGVMGAAMRAHSHIAALPQMQEQFDAAPAIGAGLFPPASRAHVLIASDFFMSPDDVDAACAAIAARQGRPVLLQVCDPAEETLAYSGRIRFEDSERPEDSVLIDDVAALRDAYHEKFAAHRETLGEIARRHGGVFIAAATTQTYAATLEHCLRALGVE